MRFSKDNIITLPNTNLRQRSKKIGIISRQITELITKMELATLSWEDSREHEVGVALASIQIDEPLRVIIIRKDFDNKKDRSFIAYINPEITKYEGELKEDFEGCLSIKEIYGKVPRYTKVRVKATNINGQQVRIKAEGFLARVFQHEIDHTNGIVYIDHIKDNKQAFFKIISDGTLEPLDYEEHIQNSNILW